MGKGKVMNVAVRARRMSRIAGTAGFEMRAGFRCRCSSFTCKETMWKTRYQGRNVYLAGIEEPGAVERGLRSEGCSDGKNPPLLS